VALHPVARLFQHAAALPALLCPLHLRQRLFVLALSDATRRLCARTDVRQLVGPSKGILQWKLPRLLESDTRVDECLKQLLLLILQCGWVAKGHKTRLLTLYHESHTWPTLAGLFST
jgi:hypothetical protein